LNFEYKLISNDTVGFLIISNPFEELVLTKMSSNVTRKEDAILTKELDWFDFETRMRDVIHELVEPIIKRASEDREIALTS
jgi:hypothetical protein